MALANSGAVLLLLLATLAASNATVLSGPEDTVLSDGSMEQQRAKQLLPAHGAECLPLPEHVVSNANLTDSERAMLGDICWQPMVEPTLTTRDSRPPGVECNAYTWCDGNQQCSVVCERGSVKIEPWLQHAMDTQNALARRLPLCMATMLGTHNSGITLADGYGNLDLSFEQYLKWIKWAGGTHIVTNNQWLSLTDQLNLGVRNVELDTHWVAGELRIAHCGGAHVSLLNKLIEAVNVVAKLVGASIRWDTETFGCTPSLSSIPVGDQRTFASALEEIGAWLAKPENAREFLVLFLDDQMDLKEWGLVPRLLDQIQAQFPRSSVFAPADLEAVQGDFPSMDALLDQGKRVMFVSGSDYEQDMADLIFPRGKPVCDWAEPELGMLDTPPTCMIKDAPPSGTGGGGTGGGPQAMLSGRILRTMTCELMYGPMNCDFVYRGINAPLLDEYTLPALVQCGLNMPCPDLLTPARAASAVWTWAEGQPFNSRGGEGGSGDQWAPVGLQKALQRADANPWLRWLAALVRLALRQLPAGVLSSVWDQQPGCSVMSASDGRWRAAPCDAEQVPTACRQQGGSILPQPVDNSTQPAWVVADGARGTCPEGYAPSVPLHPRDGLLLQLALQSSGAEQAWLPPTGPDWFA